MSKTKTQKKTHKKHNDVWQTRTCTNCTPPRRFRTVAAANLHKQYKHIPTGNTAVTQNINETIQTQPDNRLAEAEHMNVVLQRRVQDLRLEIQVLERMVLEISHGRK